MFIIVLMTTDGYDCAYWDGDKWTGNWDKVCIYQAEESADRIANGHRACIQTLPGIDVAVIKT